jgi:hypothetical protein
MKMKNKILVVIIVALILTFELIGYLFFQEESDGSSFLNSLSPHYREKYIEMNKWLEEKLIEWKPKKYQPMSFCAHHIIASERMLIKDESLDLPYLEMLKETGIDCVRLSIYLTIMRNTQKDMMS